MNFENIRFEHRSVLYFNTLKSPIRSQVDQMGHFNVGPFIKSEKD